MTKAPSQFPGYSPARFLLTIPHLMEDFSIISANLIHVRDFFYVRGLDEIHSANLSGLDVLAVWSHQPVNDGLKDFEHFLYGLKWPRPKETVYQKWASGEGETFITNMEEKGNGL